MSVFRSERTYWGEIADLTPVAADVANHFRAQKFDVVVLDSLDGGWDISIHRGGGLKAIVGLKLALKVVLTVEEDRLVVTAGMGLFGRQMAPAALTLVGLRTALMAAGATIASVVALPLLATQAWGLIKAAKLDDEAMRVVHASIERHAPEVANSLGPLAPAVPKPHAIAPASVESILEGTCAGCGSSLSAAARFCGTCGRPTR